jgi:hypothetical protein
MIISEALVGGLDTRKMAVFVAEGKPMFSLEALLPTVLLCTSSGSQLPGRVWRESGIGSYHCFTGAITSFP